MCGTTDADNVCIYEMGDNGVLTQIVDCTGQGISAHFPQTYSNDSCLIESEGAGSWFGAPTIVDKNIQQIHFDSVNGTIENNILVTASSATKWKDGNGKEHVNLSAIPLDILSRDGSMVIFTGTDGLYG